MRLLFIHANFDTKPEYSVHQTLAEHTNLQCIESYFVWQSSAANEQIVRHSHNPERYSFYDFGRDMSLMPKPSRSKRAAMMLHRLPKGLRFLAQKIQQIQPNFIYTSQQQYDVWLAKMLCTAFHIPHIIHIHYPIGPDLGPGISRAIVKTRRVIAVSEFIRENAIRAGASRDQVHTVHATIPLTPFDRPKNSDALRAEFHWPLDSQVIVAVGRLDPSKGHRLLIEAFDIVRRKNSRARLLICGVSTIQADYRQALERRVIDLGMQGQVAFAGHRDDMPFIYSGADIFCLPTVDEAFGLVFLEAMAAALPTVGVASGGVPEIIRHMETGLLSELGNVDALVANLQLLLHNDDLARQLGAAGKIRAFAKFAPEITAARWKSLLHGPLRTPRSLATVDIYDRL